MLFVHHGVAGHELQRIDGVPALGRHPAHVLRGTGGGAAQQVSLGEQGKLERLQDKTASDGGRGHLDQPGLRLVVEGVDPGARDVVVVEEFGEALGRAGAFGDDDDPPLFAHVGADEVHHFGDVALVAAGFAGVQVEDVDVGQQFLVGGQRGDRPPGHLVLEGCGAGFGERAEAGGVQGRRRRGAQIQGCGPAVGRRGPGRLKEFLVGGGEVVGAGPDLLGFDHDGHRAGRELVQERHHGVHQHGGQGLHAFDGDAAGDLLQHVRGGRQL